MKVTSVLTTTGTGPTPKTCRPVTAASGTVTCPVSAVPRAFPLPPPAVAVRAAGAGGRARGQRAVPAAPVVLEDQLGPEGDVTGRAHRRIHGPTDGPG
ncbi:hypothetical protein [Streptomyces sp. NA02950]|uniref:hypothetical protein n=1 Tax=Streptomyces sp. NA02950 TaxID=2742137 RepID=UPI0020CB090F|nr:hypothetical protein [Streptomyces sp. NA02950]